MGLGPWSLVQSRQPFRLNPKTRQLKPWRVFLYPKIFLLFKERRIDPITLITAASTAVSFIKKGCAMYREYKAVGQEAHAVMADIGKHLGGFFKAQDDLRQHVVEEEKKSKAVVKKDVSLDQQALDRVLAQRRISQMEHELRQVLVYESPPELGAIYTDFIKMREVIQQEQDEAREILEAQEVAAKWQRRKLVSDLQDKAIYVLACLVVVGFIVLMMYAIVLDRRVRWGF